MAANSLDVGGTLTIAGGAGTTTLNTSGSNLAINAVTFVVDAGGAFTANGSTITVTSIDTHLGTFTVGGSTVVVNASGGSINLTQTVNNLTVSPAISTTFTGSLTWTGTLVFTNAGIVAFGTSSLTSSGATTFTFASATITMSSGNWDTSSATTFTATSSSVTFSGTGNLRIGWLVAEQPHVRELVDRDRDRGLQCILGADDDVRGSPGERTRVLQRDVQQWGVHGHIHDDDERPGVVRDPHGSRRERGDDARHKQSRTHRRRHRRGQCGSPRCERLRGVRLRRVDDRRGERHVDADDRFVDRLRELEHDRSGLSIREGNIDGHLDRGRTDRIHPQRLERVLQPQRLGHPHSIHRHRCVQFVDGERNTDHRRLQHHRRFEPLRAGRWYPGGGHVHVHIHERHDEPRGLGHDHLDRRMDRERFLGHPGPRLGSELRHVDRDLHRDRPDDEPRAGPDVLQSHDRRYGFHQLPGDRGGSADCEQRRHPHKDGATYRLQRPNGKRDREHRRRTHHRRELLRHEH